ncbi:MAG: permease, partial [Bacteroidota bacterium]
MEYLKDFINELYFITTDMAPYLLLGFFFAGLLYLLFPKKKVRRYMGRNRNKAVINASLFGIPLPLCSCGVIPTGLSFYRNGASKGSTVSFLISTPQTGIDSILVTYSMMG